MATVTLRYWAAARAAAGVTEEKVTARTLAEALAAAGQADRPDRGGTGGPARGAGQLPAVLARSSFLIDGAPVGTRRPEDVLLDDAAVVEVLPPFAGG